jgi:WS/DGAT/MGAT family acyltransferase
MIRLNGLDSFLYYTESPTAPQHTLKIAILDPSEQPGGYSFEWLLGMLTERMHQLTPLRWKVVPTPLGLHQPVFVEDPEFDLEYHVRRVTVPAPGTYREMCEIISKITGWQINLERPLWQLWVLEGLEGGKVAAVAKVHHTLADGVASARLLTRFYTTEAGGTVPPPEEPWEPEAIPSAASLLVNALADLPGTLVREIPRNVRAIQKTREGRAVQKASGNIVKVPNPMDAPPTPFNKALTPHRSYACETFELDDVKAIRAAFGVTINDVFLAVVAGGLRRYLKRLKALPEQPLVGGMPMTIRGKGDDLTYGNKTTISYVWLHTDIEDPLERLKASHKASTEAKLAYQSKGAAEGSHFATWLELVPPMMAKTASVLLRSSQGKVSLGGNVAVSNVPGPRVPLYIDYTKLSAWFSTGQIMEGMGLNITVWSYVDQFNFSFLACRELVPDIWDLVEDVKTSMKELNELADKHKAA